MGILTRRECLVFGAVQTISSNGIGSGLAQNGRAGTLSNKLAEDIPLRRLSTVMTESMTLPWTAPTSRGPSRTRGTPSGDTSSSSGMRDADVVGAWSA